MKEDNFAIREKLYKISILYNLILSSYTLHIDNELKKKSRKVYHLKNGNSNLSKAGGIKIVS